MAYVPELILILIRWTYLLKIFLKKFTDTNWRTHIISPFSSPLGIRNLSLIWVKTVALIAVFQNTGRQVIENFFS